VHNKKRKILNDPVYGFITIPYEIIFDLIEHPYFQRLRRITQLGLTNLVYSGANHTRFQHAIGAMHLMGKAIDVIRSKGEEITEDEAIGVTIAILLHDIGHGPYSHTLENSIVEGVSHEQISEIFMQKLNIDFEERLDTAIQIFKNEHPKKFLNQLVSSQLDMDRLDYLRRDSFFTGVSEGIIGVDRIIKMLSVVNGNLVVETKGIYSIEKFLVARRLMYWQVYLHKTVISAESMLLQILKRAKKLAHEGVDLQCSSSLRIFLYQDVSKNQLAEESKYLNAFSQLDDYDILAAIKEWQSNTDLVLSLLSKSLVNRKLLKVKLQSETIDPALKTESRAKAKEKLDCSDEELGYLVFDGTIDNRAYTIGKGEIQMLHKDGTVEDIATAADLFTISAMSKPVIKHYLCYPSY
jgi:HD superfamily phosphohydrolase|tara:strand:+ start:2365 stop:3591 length:1227 start_codon:yes stop_codon:yes gene_type:complete